MLSEFCHHMMSLGANELTEILWKITNVYYVCAVLIQMFILENT